MQYPKAKYHLLLMRRNNLQHIGDMTRVKTLNDLVPSHLDEIREFHNLGRNIAANLETMDSSVTMKLGYHALPSFEPLHLHLISSDLDSPCITKRKHIISFTSPLFFVDPKSVECHLESAFIDTSVLSVRKERAASVLNDTPMTCPRCNRVAISVPDWKRHNAKCIIPTKKRESDGKLNSLLGWKREDDNSSTNRGTKRGIPEEGEPLDISGDSSNDHFDGTRTKFGRRLRKSEDKLTNSARVRNSYLKVVIDDFDLLHDTICKVGREWLDENNANKKQQSISKKQSKQQLTISPRSRHSLHMTYFFAGKVLDNMSSEEVQRWAALVRKCVSEHNERSSGEYSLRFKSLITFPPRRDYLVVAEFEPSSDLVALYDELCELACMEKKRNTADADEGVEYEFPLLRDLTFKQQMQRAQQREPSWISHVTLGNIAGGSREDTTRLIEWLSNRNYEDATTKINPSGLTLGGPIPEHAEIDWNFPFHSDSR